MEIKLPCECGRDRTVAEWQAGSKYTCACGRNHVVPSSGSLRQLAGLSPVPVDPAGEAERALRMGELDPTACVVCGAREFDTIRLSAICERQVAARTSGERDPVDDNLLIAAFGLPFRLLLAVRAFRDDSANGGWHGRETVVAMPIGVCHACRQESGIRGCFRMTRRIRGSRRRRLLKYLRQIPAYATVLHKFPNAVITFEK